MKYSSQFVRQKKNPYFNIVEKKKDKIQLVKNLRERILSRQKAPRVYEMNASIYFGKETL